MVSGNKILFLDECKFNFILECFNKFIKVCRCFKFIFEVDSTFFRQFFVCGIGLSVFEPFGSELCFHFFIKRIHGSNEFFSDLFVADTYHIEEGSWHDMPGVCHIFIQFFINEHSEWCSSCNARVDVEEREYNLVIGH